MKNYLLLILLGTPLFCYGETFPSKKKFGAEVTLSCGSGWLKASCVDLNVSAKGKVGILEFQSALIYLKTADSGLSLIPIETNINPTNIALVELCVPVETLKGITLHLNYKSSKGHIDSYKLNGKKLLGSMNVSATENECPVQ